MGATGTGILNFGVIGSPTTETTLAIIGQTGIATTSKLGAWVRLDATAEHSADEVRVEDIDIRAGTIVVGTGFTIYGRCNNGKLYGTITVDWAWV